MKKLFTHIVSLQAILFFISNPLFGFEIELKYGTISSISNELVFNQTPAYDTKLSHLIWEQENASVLGLETKIDYDTYFLNFEYYQSIFVEDAVMDDYDWVYYGYDWSHWSHHNNTTFSNFTLIDIDYKYKLFNQENKIYATFDLGLRIDEKMFQAYDGTYIYSSDGNYRDLSGTFSGLGITYSQSYITPYIGSTIYVSDGMFMLSTSYKYSQIGYAGDIDIHHFRDLRFDSSFYNIEMFYFDMKIGIVILDSLKITSSY